VGKQVVDYTEIRDTLATGDIVLFHGLGWESDLIQVVELSPWTHVAMIVRAPEIEYPMIWESTPLKFIKDVVMHKKKSGARLVSLDERLAVAVEKRFYGRFAVRQLEVERTSEMMQALINFIAGNVHYLPFPSEWKMLVEFIRGKLFKEKRVKPENVYCAELVAETYKRMGLMPLDEPSNRFTPKDFSSEGQLPLLKGAKLGKEIFLLVDINSLPHSYNQNN
jgi:hypothetical protein